MVTVLSKRWGNTSQAKAKPSHFLAKRPKSATPNCLISKETAHRSLTAGTLL